MISKRLVLLIVAVLALAAIGSYRYWQHKHPTDAQIQACINNYYKKHPGFSDADTSNCDPNIVPDSSLTSAQKDASQRNGIIVNNAMKSKDPALCYQIQGDLYIAYPADLSKSSRLSEPEAQKYCETLAN